MRANLEKKHDNETFVATSPVKRMWIFALIPLVMIVGLGSMYFWRFGICIKHDPVPNLWDSSHDLGCLYSSDMEQWGQIGDFFGGVLNPIIGLITILLVVYSIQQNQIALKQNQLALSQNEIALKQNEQALNDSRNELINSNKIMNDQKNIMDFGQKLELFNSILRPINQASHDENARNADWLMQESNPIKLTGNFVAPFYIAGSLKGLPLSKEARYFVSVASKLVYLFVGLHSTYSSYPAKSKFRETLALSVSIHVKPEFLCGIGIFILESSSADPEDLAGRKEALGLIFDALTQSGSKSYKDQLQLFLVKYEKKATSENT